MLFKINKYKIYYDSIPFSNNYLLFTVYSIFKSDSKFSNFISDSNFISKISNNGDYLIS